MKTQENVPKAQTTVLVVDDEESIRGLLKLILTMEHIHVEEACDGQEALSKLNDVQPDLILSDIFMPRIDGFELCKEVRKKTKNEYIPFVLITGKMDDEIYSKALAIGVDEFLTKPFDKVALLMKIRSLLRLRKLFKREQINMIKLYEAENLKQDMISMLAHDMKNPLTAVRGYAEILSMRKEVQTQPQIRDFVNKMLLSCDELMKMILNFLDISRMEGKKFVPKSVKFDFKDTVGAVIERLKPVLNITKQKVSFDLKGPAEIVEVDKELIERVLMNLLSNAIKYSPHGTSIVLTLEGNTDFIEFSIQDEGGGIPTKYHKTIFEKFNRVRDISHELKSDTGLGLAFCKIAIEVHGGKIWVESEVGKGSCFHIKIPRHQNEDSLKAKKSVENKKAA